jgi:hypothetical protein
MRKLPLLVVLVALVALAASACDYGLSTVDGPQPVERLRIRDPRDGKNLEVSWRAPDVQAFGGVKVVRKIGEAPKSDTDGTIVYEGDDDEFTDALCAVTDVSGFPQTECGEGVEPVAPFFFGREVFYAVFGVYQGSALSAPQVDSERVGYLQPPEFVSAFSSADTVSASWAGAVGEVTSWHVVGKRGAAAPTGPDDGDVVTDVDAATTRLDQGAVAGETWTFVVYGKDDAGTLSAPSEPATTTVIAGGPTGLVATAGALGPAPKGKITLTWTNPEGTSDAWHVVIVRRADAVPGAEDDGVVVYDGTAESAEDFFPPLDPDGDVTYRAFGCEDFTCTAGSTATVNLAVPASAGRVVRGTVDVRAVARAGADLIVGGDADGTATFGELTRAAEPGGGGFVARLGADGAATWLRTIVKPGNDDGEDGSSVRAVASSGADTFVAGFYFGAFVLDGESTTRLAPPGGSLGQFDDGVPFLMKLDENGEVIFAIRPDGSGITSALDDIQVVPLADGGALMTEVTNTFALNIYRVSSTGTVLWRAFGFGAGTATLPFSASAKHIAVTGANEITVVGAFNDSFDIGGQTLEAPNDEDRPMVLKLALDTGALVSARVLPFDADVDDAQLLPNGSIALALRPNDSPTLAGVTIRDAAGLAVVAPDDTVTWAASVDLAGSFVEPQLGVDGDALLVLAPIVSLVERDVEVVRSGDVFDGFEDPVSRVVLARFAVADGALRALTSVAEARGSVESGPLFVDGQGVIVGVTTTGQTTVLAGTTAHTTSSGGGTVIEAEAP